MLINKVRFYEFVFLGSEPEAFGICSVVAV